MCHALIIEDEPLVAMLVEDALVEAGATTVEIVVTEGEAVDAAMARRPDLIASDVNLAEGTGPAAVRAIRCAHGSIPVLFITATPPVGDPDALPGQIVRKPFSPSQLVRAFRTLILSVHREA